MASVAKLSSGVVSSEIPSPAPEGRDRIWQIQEVGGQVLTSATIYHTHYSTVLGNRIRQLFVEVTHRHPDSNTFNGLNLKY